MDNAPAILYYLEEEEYYKSRGARMTEVRLWYWRDKRRLTLVQLAEKSGVSKSQLHRIENGITSPRLKEIDAIAKALSISVAQLLDEGKNNWRIL